MIRPQSHEGGRLATVDLKSHGIEVDTILRNPAPARLYEEALRHEADTAIVSNGALVALSGAKTGRSPADKRIVKTPSTEEDVWWGSVNIPLPEDSFRLNRERAIAYLNSRGRLFVIDGFAGWDPEHQIKVRIICERAYHALFMHNMLIRPTPRELEDFGGPDAVIYNAGKSPARLDVEGVTSRASIALHLERKESVILGTEYAGEMKKGVFTLMNYLMPRSGVLSMHCSANQGDNGQVSLFFGLSGTGKTTLSADPNRALIGDDEHCWTARGIFNIEGGCYAKVIDLSAQAEPEIYGAIRFGSVLENVIFDSHSRKVDYRDTSITTNTRGSYPIEFIPNAKIPSLAGHPSNIVFLTCDAFGVLPPVSRLTPEQAMYHFISGYTAKVAGTEVGVTDPETTFSACFGAPFLVWHPGRYAEMLADRIKTHEAKTWLVNTGWTGGSFGTGKRISLPHTRAIVDAIHLGQLADVEYQLDPIFGLSFPTTCPGVPSEILDPGRVWADKAAYSEEAARLARRFRDNFSAYGSGVGREVVEAGPAS